MKKDYWNGRNVLITGANGMVGSHISKRLVNNGANVVSLIRSKNPKSYFYEQGIDQKCIVAYGDLKRFDRILDIVTRYEINVILHLGAQPIVGTAFFNPLETLRSNIDGTINVLEASRQASVQSIVVASSDKAYGKSDTLPYVEEMPMKGVAPYEVSKSCTDMLSLSYAKTYGMPVAVTRFGNIFGPGDLNFNRIIPGAIKAGCTDSTLDIRSDGKQIREYLYIEDVVDGYITLAENIKKAGGEAFNFSSGERLSVTDAIKKVGNVMKKEIRMNILDQAKSEIPVQYLSSSKVEKLLGWKSKFSFEKGIEATVPWYRKVFSW